MKSSHKYIWLVLLTGVFAFFFRPARDIYLSIAYGAGGAPVEVMANWDIALFLAMSLQNIAAAMWLWHVSGRSGHPKAMWSLFGLAFGLIGVAVYYLVSINDRSET